MKKPSEITALADSAPVAIQEVNDAILLGNNCQEFEDLMRTDATLTVGEVYTGKRRGTPDDGWTPDTRPWVDWIAGDNATWGLSIHAVTPRKDGPGYVFGACNTYRRKNAVTSVAALSLDLDGGHHTVNQVAELVLDLGYAANIYTTHSHLQTRLTLKFDDVVKRTKCTGAPTSADVRKYLLEHKKIAPHIAETADIVEVDKEAKDGWTIAVKTAPIPKMRVIFPLKEEMKISDLGATQAAALDAYQAKVLALGDMAGVVIDEACTDPSRFFYRPAHKKDAKHQTVIIQAPPLAWEDVKADTDPFLLGAGGDYTAASRADAICEDSTNATRLYQDYGKRMMLAELCEGYGLGTSANAQNGGGKFHTVCPFNHEHTDSADDTATFAVDADQSEYGYAVISCQHNACAQRKTADFIAGYIDNGDLSVDDILDSGYLLPPDEDAGEKYNRLTPEEMEDAGIVVTTESVKSQVADLSKDSSDNDVRAYLARLIEDGADTSSLNRAKTEIADVTALGKRDVDRMIKTIHAETRASQPAKKSDAINVGDGYMPVIEATIEKLITANADDPLLFSLAEQLTEVRNGRLKPLPVDPLTEVIARVVQFEKTQKMGENFVDVSTAPPLDVVKNIAYRPHDDFALPLRGVVTSPFFTAGGVLVTKPGYHADAQVYYDPPQGFVLADVPTTPTKKQANDSAHYIIEQVLADFPLGGLNRKEIMAQYNEGEGVPALANVLGLILLTFMRDMVDGPTPMHLFNKPSPGTGAGLITMVCHLIATGKPAPATPFPKNEDEAPKTLTSLLCSGIGWVNFDNVAHTIDCPELATALTEPVYMARPLGRTDTVEVEVRNVWSMTAIQSNLSAELARRTVLIDLDAQSAEPEKRTGWLHDSLPAFVIKDRAKLVQCCLTVIQYWISQGKKQYTDVVMGSYERYTAIIGGVLESVGVRGFLDNAQKLKEDTANEDAATLNLFLAELATYSEGEKFRAGQLMEILNKGCAETDNEPIMINRLGYSKVDGTYKDPAKIGRWFSKIAKKPWIVRDGSEKIEVSFEEQYDKSTKSNRYVMTKEVLSDEAA